MSELAIHKDRFATRLRDLLKEKGLTTREAGELLNLSNATISRYQSGELVPKLNTIQLMAKTFKVNEDWLTGVSDHRTTWSIPEHKDHVLSTIAAHLEDENVTDQKLDLITRYIDMIFDKF